MKRYFFATLFVISLALPASAVPNNVTLNGFLSKDGVAVDGKKDLVFYYLKLENDANAAAFHAEKFFGVQITNGVFSVLLGTGFSTDSVGAWPNPAGDLMGELAAALPSGDHFFVRVVVDGTALEPAIRVSSVPFAMICHLIDGKTFAENFSAQITSQKVVSLDQSGKLDCSGCVDATSVDATVATKTQLDAVNSKADTNSTAILSLLKDGTGTLNFSVDGKNTLKEILENLLSAAKNAEGLAFLAHKAIVSIIADVTSLLKNGTGQLNFTVNGKNTLKSILQDSADRIASLEGRVSSQESFTNSLSLNVIILQSKVSALESKVSALEGSRIRCNFSGKRVLVEERNDASGKYDVVIYCDAFGYVTKVSTLSSTCNGEYIGDLGSVCQY